MSGTEPERDLLVAGHVNVDRFLAVVKFPRADRTVPVRAERTELGGTATNLVLVARRLGLRAGLLASVGDGFPEEFRRRLRRERIDLRGLKVRRGLPTPTCTIVEESAGTSRTLIQQGPMADRRHDALPGGWWREYRWLHLSTGDPAYYLRLAAAARAVGLRVALDPAQEIFYRWDRDRFRTALASAEVLFGNRAEIEQAVGWSGGRLATLLARVPLIVRTEGPRGASAFSRRGTVHAPGLRSEPRRTLVGAGDAFRAGFYAAWFHGLPTTGCLEAGNRAAARWIGGAFRE